MKRGLTTKKITSLYVHIPFCEHICFYCDFVKEVKPKNSSVIYEYLDNLAAELAGYKNELNALKTIYIGGGTPSCLDEAQTTRLCEILAPFVKKTDFEYTIELNPESVTRAKLKIYQKYHINRLSIGVQTFDNDLLKKIGRVHDNSIAIEKFLLAREIGFTNISLDLMYNLFNQTSAHIKSDLAQIRILKPDHISWYSLIMKDNSVWGRRKLQLPENDEEFDQLVNNGLKDLGFQRYEISNYALDNKISQHNLAYWNNSLFAGVGVGAAGFEFINDAFTLTTNVRTKKGYEKHFEPLSTTDYYFQILMMGLRLVKGIDLNEIDCQKMYQHFKIKISKQIKLGFLEIVDNHLRCTLRGFNIMNEILVDIL